MTSVTDEAEVALNIWFSGEYNWTPEQALKSTRDTDYYGEWENIIDAFIAGYKAGFWREGID